MPNSRPTSPHLGIYRWRVNMWQSTLHRLTGLFLCIGTVFVTWGLIAAASSGAAWSAFAGFSASWIGQILWFLWVWSLLFHLCNGFQHLMRDVGMNYGPANRDRTHNPVYWSGGWAIIAISVVLTIAVWLLLILRVAGGAA